MLAKIKIRNKILILFTLFALLLLSTIVVYIYIYGISYVKDQAIHKSNHYASQFIHVIEEEINHSVIEISGLRTQLSFISTETVDVPPPAFTDAIEAFLQAYSNKYSSITVFNRSLNSVTRFSPVRLFTGDMVIQTDPGSIHPLVMKSPVTLVGEFMGHEKVFANVSRSDPGIYVVSMIDDATPWNLLFSIRLDAIADKGLQAINPDRNATVAIYDSGGITVFSNEKRHMYIPAAQLIDGNHAFLFDPDESKLMLSSAVYSKSRIEVMNAGLLVKIDITPSLEELNSVLLQAILFVLVIFSIVTAIVITISSRISKSIAKMASVADTVAAGDLNQKIDIDRKDELGVLINSFNQMVEKLKISYQNLQITNKDLEEKIEELTTTKAKLSEKEKLAVIGETVSKISHEIQNKIGGISIWIQNLELQYSDDVTALMYLNEIKSTLNSFLYMLINFKKFYRVPQLNTTMVDVKDLIERVVESYKSDSEKKRVNIMVHIGSNVPRLSLDAMLMEEVILNLLINAAYYSPEDSTIIIRCTAFDRTVEIEVHDEGPGIQKEVADKIFVPFFTTKPSGSGLGLAIAKNVIEAHSGSVTVSNHERGGACFRIILPINESTLTTNYPYENINRR
jgi:signal transduction histidine kinase